MPDPNDGAGWNISTAVMICPSRRPGTTVLPVGSLKVAPDVGMYVAFACAGDTMNAPSAKIMSATKGWTSFFMKNLSPEFSHVGKVLTCVSAPGLPRFATPASATAARTLTRSSAAKPEKL